MVRRFSGTGKLVSSLASCIILSFMRMIHWVGRTTFGSSLRWRFGLVLLQNLWRLPDVGAELSGFFWILWSSSAEIHLVKELLAFVLLMRSVSRFPFIQHMTFRLARSYRRTIVASNFGVMPFRLRSRSVCAKFTFLSLRSKWTCSLKSFKCNARSRKQGHSLWLVAFMKKKKSCLSLSTDYR